ncbi:lipoprotein [Spiroplasma endosymbiont of Cantharis nigra]|uniref:lipoprotein n=1 Tax=Spiroplasma endosymbiont of Cantharis nigra TaxID=3066278 RepID=UPI0030CDE219
MKKLLSLLGTVSLVATSSATVISCGGTVPPTVIPNEKLALIEELKKDLNSVIESYWLKINNNFFDLTSNQSTIYNFIQMRKIKELLGNNPKEALIGDKLSENDKILLIKDIQKIVQEDNFKKFLLDNIDSKKYSILLEGINLYNGFNVDWNTLEINYTEDSINNSQREDSFLSYIKVNLVFNFQYLDSEGQTASYKSSKNFIFTLTSNELLIASISNLEKGIKSDYFLESQDYSWLDAKSFGYNDDQYKKVFLPKNNDFKNIYEGKAFKENIITYMKSKYFKQIPSVPLEFNGDIIFDKFTKKDFVNANTAKSYDWKDSMSGGQKMYNSIFSKFENNSKAQIFGVDSDINTYMYNYLRDNFMNFQKDYLVKFNNFISNLEKESSIENSKIKDEIKNNSISFGEVKLKGLSIKINESYIHPINDLSIFTSIAVSNLETKENREEAAFSSLFGAMYYNMISGIQEFQSIFDIKPRGAEDLPIASFSGNGSSVSGDADNIWNGIKVSGNQFTQELNNSLSLNNTNLKKHRDILLENSNQSIFNWAINRDSIGAWHRVDDIGIVQGGYYGSFAENELEWIFKQNFINVKFLIKGIWKENNRKMFIKRAESN